jgi:hypothetical protein
LQPVRRAIIKHGSAIQKSKISEEVIKWQPQPVRIAANRFALAQSFAGIAAPRYPRQRPHQQLRNKQRRLPQPSRARSARTAANRCVLAPSFAAIAAKR